MNNQQQRQRNCRDVVKRTFPGIAYSSYLRTAELLEHDPKKVANLICSDMESGQPYKTKAGNARKRKRGDDEQDGKIKRQNVKPCGSEDPNSGNALIDCQCCFYSIPMGQVGYCNRKPAHAFCIDCLRRNVESQVEHGNYQVMCISTNKCNAGFSKQERDKFIGESLSTRLARCEQKEQLRLADIRGLVNCPFCDYAEEYPDISVTKEFKCRNPECEITSCRHCNEKTHIPMSCTDAAVARSPDIRHKIEEAMSRALIRHCNKCGTSFVKEEGCNKMTCAIKGCRNVQCYVCSQSCDYNHFNDLFLGGKGGKCPLYDNVKRRHEREVREAENAARKMLSEGASVDSAIVLE